MKKTLLTLSALSLFAFNVQAAEQTKPVNTKTSTTQKAATKTATAKKTATTEKSAKAPKAAPAVQEQSLKEFNQNANIKLVQRATAVQNNQPVAVLVYEVTNRGKNNIKMLDWSSAFTIDNKVFYVHNDIKPVFEKGLGAGKKETVTLTILLEKLPENIRAVFVNTNTPIGHITVAKQIDFTNGKQIIVKE